MNILTPPPLQKKKNKVREKNMHCRHHCIIEKLLHLILEGRLITSILFKVPREDLALYKDIIISI